MPGDGFQVRLYPVDLVGHASRRVYEEDNVQREVQPIGHGALQGYLMLHRCLRHDSDGLGEAVPSYRDAQFPGGLFIVSHCHPWVQSLQGEEHRAAIGVGSLGQRCAGAVRPAADVHLGVSLVVEDCMCRSVKV